MFDGLKPSERNLRYWQVGFLLLMLFGWHLLSRNEQYAFFIGEPIKVAMLTRPFAVAARNP